MPKGSDAMKFEEKILLLRKKKGMSLEGLARKLKVTRQAVYKWETGICRPEIEKIILLSQIFNVRVEDLMDDSVSLNMIIEINNENVESLKKEENIEIEEARKNAEKETYSPKKKQRYLFIAIAISIVIVISIVIIFIFSFKHLGNKDTDTNSGANTSTNLDTEASTDIDTNNETSIDTGTDTNTDTNIDKNDEIITDTTGLIFERIEGKNEYQLVSIGTETGSKITIPSSYKGLPVTRICSYAFNGCDFVIINTCISAIY